MWNVKQCVCSLLVLSSAVARCSLQAQQGISNWGVHASAPSSGVGGSTWIAGKSNLSRGVQADGIWTTGAQGYSSGTNSSSSQNLLGSISSAAPAIASTMRRSSSQFAVRGGSRASNFQGSRTMASSGMARESSARTGNFSNNESATRYTGPINMKSSVVRGYLAYSGNSQGNSTHTMHGALSANSQAAPRQRFGGTSSVVVKNVAVKKIPMGSAKPFSVTTRLPSGSVLDIPTTVKPDSLNKTFSPDSVQTQLPANKIGTKIYSRGGR